MSDNAVDKICSTIIRAEFCCPFIAVLIIVLLFILILCGKVKL